MFGKVDSTPMTELPRTMTSLPVLIPFPRLYFNHAIEESIQYNIPLGTSVSIGGILYPCDQRDGKVLSERSDHGADIASSGEFQVCFVDLQYAPYRIRAVGDASSVTWACPGPKLKVWPDVYSSKLESSGIGGCVCESRSLLLVFLMLRMGEWWHWRSCCSPSSSSSPHSPFSSSSSSSLLFCSFAAAASAVSALSETYSEFISNRAQQSCTFILWSSLCMLQSDTNDYARTFSISKLDPGCRGSIDNYRPAWIQ